LPKPPDCRSVANTLTELKIIPPPYLSPSSIDTFRQCPLKFKYSRIDRILDAPTEATVLGSFVHAVLEDLLALPADQRTLEMCRSLMASQWAAEWEQKTIDVIGTTTLRNFRWRAWWCIENYFKIEDPTTINPSGIEHELNGLIEGIPIKGFIDRWESTDDGIVISDYKTGKTPSRLYLDDKFFQLIVYAQLLCEETEKPLNRVELLYLKDGVRFQASEDIDTKLNTMKQVVIETHAGVIDRCIKGEFEPIINKFCNWCSYKPMCPAWKKEK